jgi:coniferyl-aldehyde dehydrogenase
MRVPLDKGQTSRTPGDVQAAITEMRRTYERQRAAWNAAVAPIRETRVEALDRLSGVLTRHADEIAMAISVDFGNRARQETQLLEIVPALNAIRYAKRNLSRWMSPNRCRVAWTFKPGRAWVQYQPVGLIGVIAPWNYPVLLTLTPVVDALAAGNRVMVKPSELTPRFSDLLKRRLAEAFSDEELAVITGGPDIADAFSRLPFDHLLFTGTSTVARKVMAAAAANLTPLTLELGGKSPVLICPDYDVRRAAHDIAFGKFSNAGQTCIAPDYVLAPSAKADTLAEALIHRARQLYPTIAANPDYSSIVSDSHFQRLSEAIEAARLAGAMVVSHSDEQAAAARKIGPTVIVDPPADSMLMREEIFGPIMPIVRYDTLDNAIAHINANDRPLALYCLTHDPRSRDRVLSLTVSGGVTVNGTLLHFAQQELPFGGVGMSGFGAYHGWEGFKRFSHARAVHHVRGFNVFDLVAPPYGRRVERIARFMIGR